MNTMEIQRALRARGFHPGPTDGVRGRLTIAAIRAFQRASGLSVDGLAGPETQGLLAARTSRRKDVGVLASPLANGQMRPWFDEAHRLKGTREGQGAADNPLLLRWARALKLPFAHDSVAWCGLFVAHCVGSALPEEPLPTNPLGARAWLSFGRACEPTPGAVLVFWRGARTGWRGHVGFYAGEDDAAFHVLGGNQSDAVTVSRIARTRLLGARWPRTAPPPKGGAVRAAGGAALSVNEA